MYMYTYIHCMIQALFIECLQINIRLSNHFMVGIYGMFMWVFVVILPYTKDQIHPHVCWGPKYCLTREEMTVWIGICLGSCTG